MLERSDDPDKTLTGLSFVHELEMFFLKRLGCNFVNDSAFNCLL